MGADSDHDISFTLTTRAELAGAQALEASLERDIGKAKALGNVAELAKLQPQLATVREATKNAQIAQEELTDAESKGSEEAEHLHLSHLGLHMLFTQLGTESVPAFGHALSGALYGQVGIAIALFAAIRGVQEAFAEAAKAEKDFGDALASGVDLADVTKTTGDFADAISRSVIAADEFETALGRIKSAQDDIKTSTEAAITAINEQFAALGKIAKAKADAAKADIEADYATGKISKEEEIRRLAALENKSARDQDQRAKDQRDAELAAAQKGMAAAAVAATATEAAVPAARTAADSATEGPERLKKLVESLQAQIKAAEERDKKIIDQIGPIGFSNNDKTDFTSKLPGATSDEAVRYQTGKAQIEADQKLIEDFKAKLAQLDNTTTKVHYDEGAAAAAAHLKDVEEAAKKAAAELVALQKQVADLTAKNKLADATDPVVAANEEHARNTKANAEIVSGDQKRETEDVRGASEDLKYLDTHSLTPDNAAEYREKFQDMQAKLADANNILAELGGLGADTKKLATALLTLQKDSAEVRTLAQRALDAAQHH